MSFLFSTVSHSPFVSCIVVGCDSVGEVVAIGSKVNHISVGERVAGFVFGTSDESNGAYAEFVTSLFHHLSTYKLTSLDDEHFPSGTSRCTKQSVSFSPRTWEVPRVLHSLYVDPIYSINPLYQHLSRVCRFLSDSPPDCRSSSLHATRSSHALQGLPC